MVFKRMGDLLLSIGLITDEQLESALEMQKTTKKRLGQVLIESGMITEKELIEALKMQLGIEFIDLSNVAIPAELSRLVSKNIAKKHGVVPVRLNKDTLYLAMSDPLNFVAVEEVKSASRKRIIPMIATSDAVDRAIMTLYGNEGAVRAIEDIRREGRSTINETTFSTTSLDDDAQTAPTIRLVNSIIERAVIERASDIHLEPQDDEMMVRMRIDGVMRNIFTVPKEAQSAVVSRLKIMGAMDISERKIPQDGRANVTVKREEIDLRMSTLPTINGEKFVIRLLDKNTQILDKDAIGLTGHDLRQYELLLKSRSGVILVVGPTGSGKSSTLYTMMRELNTSDVNLVTLEDPVEYHIEGINQVQINEKTGMTFANGLRAILRQDPDIISVGEIRDDETAEIAMRAAITGHLVLSTVHTNNAVSAIDRLLNIGVEPYLIAAAMRGIISQRLVRRICKNCKKEHATDDSELVLLGFRPGQSYTFYKGEGCPMCFHTGYRGRIAVFEILLLNNDLRKAISESASRDRLIDIMERSDFVPMVENCRRLALNGVTTVEEVLRAVSSSDL